MLQRVKLDNKDGTRWCVVGPDGAVDFWFFHSTPTLGGIEEHRRIPPSYRKDGPDHEQCHLLTGPCWHDGSSLYASEVLIPLYQNYGEDALGQQLEREYRERFNG
jgi:hypothetical protein